MGCITEMVVVLRERHGSKLQAVSEHVGSEFWSWTESVLDEFTQNTRLLGWR